MKVNRGVSLNTFTCIQLIYLYLYSVFWGNLDK